MNIPKVHAGLDISKAFLDLAFLTPCARGALRFPNNPRGIASLIARLQSHGGDLHVVVEASGGYERAVVNALHKHAITVSLVFAGRVRQFARSSGILAKTDAIDARLLARYGEAISPRPTPPADPQVAALGELERQRRHLTVLCVAEQTRLHQLTEKTMIKAQKQLIALLKRQVSSLQARIKDLIEQSAPLRTKAKVLTAFQGVGPCTCASLLALMPELGSLNRAEAASLAGVAPFNRESGCWRGKSMISGGRKALRCALYMATLSTIRFNPLLRDFYQRLRSKGKPSKLALTAVMRKLIIALNASLKPPFSTS